MILKFAQLPVAIFLILVAVPVGSAADSAGLEDRLIQAQDSSLPTSRANNILKQLRAFYAQRDYRPFWFEDSRLSPRGQALLNALAKAAEHGLIPETYSAKALAERASKLQVEKIPELEINLTLAYLKYAADVSSGILESARRKSGTDRDVISKWLQDIAGAEDFVTYFDRLPPGIRGYKDLKAALANYRKIDEGGAWQVVDKGPALQAGMKGTRVAQIKRRLIRTGEIVSEGDAQLFDDDLVAGVKKFQQRHGLKEDGNVGADTIAELNVPVSVRIDQITINLERLRGLSANLGERYILVNVANNELKIIENDKTIYAARVIVGRPDHETPVFSALLTYIEINPYWNVPHGIAVNELLPKIKANPGFLSANGYLLLRRNGDNSSAIEAASVDWSTVSQQNFPYFLRQKPGPQNALGTIAFMFPNPHNVFIHDTPGKSLFGLTARYFSHGCVRVQFPVKLALLLLDRQENGQWNENRINSIFETNEQTRVELKRPIPVNIAYATAWAEMDGAVHFRKDTYKRDGKLKRVIEQVAQK